MRALAWTAVLVGSLAACSSTPAPDGAPADMGVDATDTAHEACHGSLCSGACVDTQIDVHHCGACSIDCTRLAGVDATRVTCSSGQCDVASACLAGRAHCSAVATDGCETDTTTLSDCGACNHACPAPPNGVAMCMAGTCSLACDAGFARIGDACVSMANVRPLAPANGAVVTTRRPTLRWSLASGRDGAHVELCHDRACTNGIAAFDVAGSSLRLASALAPGVVFWRLHARTGTVPDADASATWSFVVPHRNTAVDSAWGNGLADVDGDGFDDVLVGASGAQAGVGRAYVFAGGSSGIATTPSARFDGERAGDGFFGTSADFAGDVDADGFADVTVSSPALTASTGIAQLFSGSAMGSGTSASWTYAATTGPDSFLGNHVTTAGDVNGDGFADLLVSSRGADPHPGLAYVFAGATLGPSAMPSSTLMAPHSIPGAFGSSLAAAGDVNGDGFVDVVIGSPATTAVGHAFVFFGSSSGPLPTAAVLAPSDSTEISFGTTVAGLGDVDGDGFADVAVGATESASLPGRVFVHLGSAAGPVATPSVVLVGPGGAGGAFGWALASAGDVNGDGHADLVVSANGAASQAGRVYLYLAHAGSYGPAPDATLSGTDGPGEQFGLAVACANDVNADGYADVVVGSLGGSNHAGRIYLYLGSAGGLATSPQAVIDGPDGAAGVFGRAVAHRGSRRHSSAS